MDVKATVLIKPDQDGRRDTAVAQEAAQLLQENGVNVLRVGRTGISVSAPSADFLRVLGVAPEPDMTRSYPVQASDQRLQAIIQSLDVAAPARKF
ncbi:MAG: hypothetical protein ACRCTD_05320 [Beijerinckiaceae bacterium]